MNRNNRWFLRLTNIVLGGMYVIAILSLIHWVSSGDIGIIGFFIPLGMVLLPALVWIVIDIRKNNYI